MKTKPIILIAGEPNSIFFEIFFKAIKLKSYRSPLILICCKKILLQQMKKNKLKKKLNVLELNKLRKYNFDNNDLNLIDIKCKKLKKSFTTKLTNQYLENSFKLALKLMDEKFSNKLINGPINKKSFLNKKYLGITEYISTKYKSKKTAMLIYNKKLSVCPATTHLPIKLVAKNITKKLIEEKINIIHTFFKEKLNYKPKIAVTGMNPHCESISKFNEDDKIVSRAIISQKKRGIYVSGPYPADTIFLKKNRDKFNVILGMYHDQVLAPIKTLCEFDAINITMGLPFIRITPDHGPNEKMLGKNVSNPISLINALNFLDKH
ncbi:4-hydroxythreonine-4-phosphate dehydrogenase PdxA [Pelagibacterales bacterium SAG-MED43]|nr:4-hydroxythreonine-4-phosphate dehydrogenase PdxA [Pelagibacterales bacterium SAG-MED43]